MGSAEKSQEDMVKTLFVAMLVVALSFGAAAYGQSLTPQQAQACQQDVACAKALIQAQTVGLDAANAADYVAGLAQSLVKKNAG